MMYGQWLTRAGGVLAQAGIATARLDTLVLLEDRLVKDRAWILAHPEMELAGSDENVLNEQIGRRAGHVPLAYVRGRTEFYGREFIISEAVLEPRPESETMIDLLKVLFEIDPDLISRHPRLDQGSSPERSAKGDANVLDSRLRENGDEGAESAENRPIRVADVGAGSGALGITAALELPGITVDLLEIDDKALKIAKINVVAKTTEILAIHSDLLAQSNQNYDILLCNLPYVPDDFHINTAALHEPKIAIFGGPDGLDLYRKLFDQLKIVEKKPLYILIEILPFQKEALLPLAKAAKYRLVQSDDFIQVFKYSK